MRRSEFVVCASVVILTVVFFLAVVSVGYHEEVNGRTEVRAHSHLIELSKYVGARLVVCESQGKLDPVAYANIKNSRELFGDQAALCQAVVVMRECQSGRAETQDCETLLGQLEAVLEYQRSIPAPVGQ